MKSIASILLIGMLFVLSMCCDEDVKSPYVYSQTPYVLPTISNFPLPISSPSNPITVEKVRLGRMLFYDPIISMDSSLACARCHLQALNFSDDRKLSINLDGPTKRNSMPLVNLAYTKNFFWDGRKSTVEDATLDALNGEQHFNFVAFNAKIANHTTYQKLFYEAFGTTPQDGQVEKAIASFLRTIVSYNSAFDKGAQEGDYSKYIGASAIRGADIFVSKEGDCFHCHGDVVSNNLFTDNNFHNNALDSIASNDYNGFKDIGHGKITNILSDNGKFKSPSIRNILFSAPYFHDGRTATIDGVLGHYNSNQKQSPTVDVNLDKVAIHGQNLNQQQLYDLKSFLLSLTDSTVIKDTTYSNPFK
jgi:cytochrome c peroxidase